jgi:hypothetical protein
MLRGQHAEPLIGEGLLVHRSTRGSRLWSAITSFRHPWPSSSSTARCAGWPSIERAGYAVAAVPPESGARSRLGPLGRRPSVGGGVEQQGTDSSAFHGVAGSTLASPTSRERDTSSSDLVPQVRRRHDRLIPRAARSILRAPAVGPCCSAPMGTGSGSVPPTARRFGSWVGVDGVLHLVELVLDRAACLVDLALVLEVVVIGLAHRWLPWPGPSSRRTQDIPPLLPHVRKMSRGVVTMPCQARLWRRQIAPL